MKKKVLFAGLILLIPFSIFLFFLLSNTVNERPILTMKGGERENFISGKGDFASHEFPTFVVDSESFRDPQTYRNIQSMFRADVLGFSYDESESQDDNDAVLEVNESETEVLEVTYDEDEVEVTEVLVINNAGEEVDMEIDQNGDEIVVYPPEDSFRPGHYVLQVTFETSDGIVVSEEDFSWGVLTINTDRSLYRMTDMAYLQMGVLNDAGHTICDAVLELEITSPAGDIAQLSTDDDIVREPECGPDNVISVPDYYAYFDIPDEEGTYEMVLTATTANGVHTIHDTFEVASDVPYDIRREAPTRIYPYATYPVRLTITATQDFEGTLVEKVPADFFVDQFSGVQPYDDIETDADYSIVTWNLVLLAGQEVSLGYTFDAPDISPEIFFLGPAKVFDIQESGVFEETRRWQIASDAACTSKTGTLQWSDLNDWNVGCTGIGGIPGTGDDVTIANGAVMTYDVTGLTINSLTFATGGTNTSLTHSGTNTLTVSTTVTMNQPSTNTRTKAWNINGGTATVNGSIVMPSTSTTTSRKLNIAITTGTLNANGGLNTTGATGGSTALVHNITMSGGAGTLNLKGAISTVSVAGAGGWTFTMGTAGSNFKYVDTSAQVVYFPGSGAYHNLVLNNTAGVTLNAAVTAARVTGHLTVGDGTTAAIFNDGQATTVGNAAKIFTVKNAATFNMTGTAAYPTGFGTFTYEATSTVNYKQTNAALTITNATYGNLGLLPAATATRTFPSATLNVLGDITLGNGTNTTTVVAAAANDANIGGNWLTNANASFTHSSRTVTFNATSTGKTIDNRVSSFYNVIFNGVGGGWTPVTNTMSVANTLTLTTGTLNVVSVGLTVTDVLTVNATLIQTTSNISTKGVVVGGGGSWTNTSTGDIALGTSGVSNAGTITLDGTALGCGDADAIALTERAGGNAPPWSGAGTFSLTDLTISNQTGSATLVAQSSTNSGGNGGNWTINASCAPTSYTWDGGGSTNNWSEAANWDNNQVPLDGFPVYFNSTSTKNCTMDTAFLGDTFNIQSGYTGTITHAEYLELFSFNQDDGTFLASSTDILWTYTLDITGGVFTSSSSLIYVANDLTQTGGTFNHNNGEVVLSLGSTIDMIDPFYDLTLGLTAAVVIVVTGTVIVENDLFIQAVTSLDGGTLEVGGDLISVNPATGGTIAFILNGTGTQLIDATGGGDFPSGVIIIDKTSGTAQLASSIVLNGTGQDFTITDGSFDMSTYSLTVDDILTVNDTLTQGSGNISTKSIVVGASGIWTNTSTGDVAIGTGGVSNAGTITLDGTAPGCGDADAIALTGSSVAWSGAGTFNLTDLTVTSQAGSATLVAYSSTDGGGNGANWTINTTCPSVSFTWDGGGSTNNWSEDANWTNNTEPGVSDTAVFDATSTKNCTIDTAISVGGVDINTGYSGTFTHSAALTVGSGNYDQNAGTFTGGSTAIDINGDFILSTGTFTSTSGNLTISGSLTQSGGTFAHNSGTVILDGTGGTPSLSLTGPLNHLTINNSTGAYTISGTLDVNGNSILTALASLTGGTITSAGNFTSNDSSFTGTTAVTFDGSSQQTLTASSTDVPGGTITVSNTSTGVLFASNIAFDTAGQDLTVTNGDVDMSTYNLTVDDTVTINADKLIQGTGNVTLGTVSIGASGEWENLSTGDINIGSGGVANAGVIDLNAGGLGCGSDSIQIRSTASPTQRSWSGAGTFSLYDIDMQDMSTAAALKITSYSSTSTGNNDSDFIFVYPCGAILTVSAPSTASFPSLTTDVSIQTHDINFSSALQVQDGRNGTLGFSVDITTTNFIDGAKSIAYGNMDFKTGTASSPIGSSLTGITAPTQVYTAFSGGGATSTAISVLTSDTTQKHGVWEVTPNLQLRVPAYVSPGSYNATLTITVN